MASNKNNRKKAVVNAQVQWSLAFRVVLHFFIFVCAGAVLGLINQFLVNPFGGARENAITFFRNSAPVMLALICLLPIFIRDTLTLSNRIAGPIYNLRNTIRRIADGEQNVRPLQFRKNDFWSDLPEEFNRMTDRLRTEQQAKGTTEVCLQAAPEATEESTLVSV